MPARILGSTTRAPLDRTIQSFPKLKMLLAHGGYPAVIEACALVTKHPNLYISPDIYCHFSRGKIYVEVIAMLPDQFIYVSAYPLGTIKESLDAALQFPLSDDVMQKYLYGNAATFLKLE
jgi:predicted TIM-barrel fold metal-dependent hydrolase